MRLCPAHILIIGTLLVGSVSCVKRPEGVQSDSKMVSVVADMTLADAYLGVQMGDNRAKREAMAKYILDKHGISQAEYDSTMSWYARNSDAYYEFSEKVEKELRIKRAKIKGAQLTNVVQNDLWPYPRMAVISPLGATDGFDFSVPTVDVKPGERVRLKMRFNNSSDGKILFGVEYDNGIHDYITASIRNRNVEVTVQTDSTQTVRRIFGNMRLNDGVSRTLWLDSISMATLPFDSIEYFNLHAQRQYSIPTSRRRPKAETADSI